jgi:hypothetical protein
MKEKRKKRKKKKKEKKGKDIKSNKSCNAEHFFRKLKNPSPSDCKIHN